jgi:hypothetical protein
MKVISRVCRISNTFEIEFIRPLRTVGLGVVEKWNLKEIGFRVPGYGGGRYIYHHFAIVSLNKFGIDSYEITDLSLYCEGRGWCSVISGGEFTEVDHD